VDKYNKFNNMKLRKSQGLSINTIVMAVIALLVLVIIITIFTRFYGKSAENIGSCSSKGGICANDVQLDGGCKGEYPIQLIVQGDCSRTTPENLCCLKIGNE